MSSQETHSLGILKKLVSMHKRVELPRFVLVKTASGLTSRIPQSLLTPTFDEFDVEITDEHIVVTKKIQVQMETLSTICSY